jgi:predicted nucleic acid-binding protein
MIILDSNVLSETLKPRPAEVVARWLAAQDPANIFTTTIAQAEMLYGVELLPDGKRRTRLLDTVEKIFADFGTRILPFDEIAARHFARIVAAREKVGHTLPQLDAMMLAIALSQQAAVATRNVGHFEECGIQIINPWTD